MSDLQIDLLRKNGAEGLTPYDDAVIFHSAVGDDYTGSSRGIVFQGIYKEFAYSYNASTRKIAVQAGYGMLYGRQFKLATGTTFEVSVGGMNAYLLIYVEVDATADPETATLKSSYAAGIQPTIGNVDIYKTKSGVATMPLFMFNVSDGGGVLTLIKDYRHIREPGVAETALSVPADGTINGTVVADLVEGGQTGYVKKARSADVATTALSIGPAGNTNQIDANLKFTKKNCRMLLCRTQTLTISSEIESGTTVNASWDAPTGTLVGFLVSVSAQAYQRPSSYEAVVAGGYIDAATSSFYATIEDTVRNTPLDGIRFDLSTYCWAMVSLTATGIAFKALEKIHSATVTVTLLIGGA